MMQQPMRGLGVGLARKVTIGERVTPGSSFLIN
jgi:hypothetical protein